MFDFRFSEPYPFELLGSFAERHACGRRQGNAGSMPTPSSARRSRSTPRPGAKNVNAGWPARTVISRFDPDPSTRGTAARRPSPPSEAWTPSTWRSTWRSEPTSRPGSGSAFLNHDQAEVRGAHHDPNTVVTLSDAGAHADQLCDACYSTHLLGHWVREQGRDDASSDAVHALTDRPATLVGLTDRGRLEVGRPADIVVFDPDTVGTSTPRRVKDLPGGAERLVADAYGIDAVIVNGVVVRRNADDQVGPDDESARRVAPRPARPPPGDRGPRPRPRAAQTAAAPPATSLSFGRGRSPTTLAVTSPPRETGPSPS